MPFVGITPPSGGVPPERRAERDRKVRRVERVAGVERPVDEAELSSVERAHRADPVQEAATEEGSEDRASHNTSFTYAPGHPGPRPVEPRRIDVEG
ncbi:MAG: hypothetical protein Tsb0013_09470 [Phycisphaerales bacterium]